VLRLSQGGTFGSIVVFDGLLGAQLERLQDAGEA
jgi:hypothetical protein